MLFFSGVKSYTVTQRKQPLCLQLVSQRPLSPSCTICANLPVANVGITDKRFVTMAPTSDHFVVFVWLAREHQWFTKHPTPYILSYIAQPTNTHNCHNDCYYASITGVAWSLLARLKQQADAQPDQK